MLAPVALWLAVAPLAPEPHLVEKLRMLAGGTLHRPIDVFDLFMHGTPLLLLILRITVGKGNSGAGGGGR